MGLPPSRPRTPRSRAASVKTTLFPATGFAGTVTAAPSVAGRVLKHAESFTAGTKPAFVVPKTAKGKLLKVKVKIVNGTQSATKVVTYKVR